MTWRLPCKNSWALQQKSIIGGIRMSNMITMFDASDNKIGETFFRRAKQLVKQQRATWTSDDQKAIKFVPGMENLSEETDDGTSQDSADEKWIHVLAIKRIQDRKLFRWHSFSIVPSLFIAFLVAAVVVDAAFGGDMALLFLGLAWGSLSTAYFIHVFFYVRKYPIRDNALKKARKEREIAAEIAAIKSSLSE